MRPTQFGVRTRPIGTVTQFESTGGRKAIASSFSANYRIPQRNIFMNVNYTLAQGEEHADSATALPANNLDPDAEWGPSRRTCGIASRR